MTPRPAPMRLRDLADELPTGLREALEESAVARLPTAQQLIDLEARLREQLAAPSTADARIAPVRTASAKLVMVPLVIAIAGGAWLLSTTKRPPAPPAAHITAPADERYPLAESAPELASPSAPQPLNHSLSAGVDLPPSDPSHQATRTNKTADERVRAADRRINDGPGEVELLAHARRVLVSNPALAQKLVRDHERRFADGLLVEEREAIAIQALAHAGSLTQARSRALSFVARFPNSAYASAVASVLEDATRTVDTVPKR